MLLADAARSGWMLRQVREEVARMAIRARKGTAPESGALPENSVGCTSWGQSGGEEQRLRD